MTIIAAFNGIMVRVGALVLGVPVAGTITIVTFVTAYVPFIGALDDEHLRLCHRSRHGGRTRPHPRADHLLANGALQNVLQPFVFGATLSLNPLVVLVVTIGAGSLFGMVGLTLAAPLTSAAVHISGRLKAEGGTGRAPPTHRPSPPR